MFFYPEIRQYMSHTRAGIGYAPFTHLRLSPSMRNWAGACP
jgi:hypothetical protein